MQVVIGIQTNGTSLIFHILLVALNTYTLLQFLNSNWGNGPLCQLRNGPNGPEDQ